MINKTTRNGLLILLAGGIAVLPFLPTPNTLASDWAYFLGRFHLLLLHFPVALILLLVGLELWTWFKLQLDNSLLKRVLWGLALLTASSTIFAGYLLYQTGDYQGPLVRQHLWGGVGSGLLLLLTYSWRSRAVAIRYAANATASFWAKSIYPLLLTATGGLVIYTSHLGGSLTHGPGFLSEYAPTLATTQLQQKPVEELLLFEDILLPIFASRCQSCHNAYKTKGDFLMTSLAGLQAGGKSGKASLVPGKVKESELYHRVTLPLSDEERMPPQQKKGLSEDELALLRWWIEEGAQEDMQWGVGPPGFDGSALADRFLPTFYQQQKRQFRHAQELAALTEKLEKLGTKWGIHIRPDETKNGFFTVAQTIPPAPVYDETLMALRPYAHLFTKISLPGSEITDDGLFALSQMQALEALYLPKTCLTGKGLAYLKELPQLQIINLSYSFVSDEGALHLLALPALEKVYLFGTSVSPAVWEALEKFKPQLSLLAEEGPYF